MQLSIDTTLPLPNGLLKAVALSYVWADMFTQLHIFSTLNI